MLQHVEYNAVHLIESLPAGQGHPARQIHEDVLKWKEFSHSGFSSHYFDVGSAKDLMGCLANIHSDVANLGVLPLLHFDMHGSKLGIALRNGDFVAWADLKPPLQRINIATCNNLLITMSTCNGWYLAKTLAPTDRSPVYGLLGCKREISFEESQQAFTRFYTKLLTTESIEDMLDALGDSSPFLFTSCVDMFVVVMRNYIAQNDNVVTLVGRTMEALSQAGVQAEERPDLLCDAAAELADLKGHFRKFKRRFFMTDICEQNAGRFPFTYEDVKALAALPAQEP